MRQRRFPPLAFNLITEKESVEIRNIAKVNRMKAEIATIGYSLSSINQYRRQ